MWLVGPSLGFPEPRPLALANVSESCLSVRLDVDPLRPEDAVGAAPAEDEAGIRVEVDIRPAWGVLRHVASVSPDIAAGGNDDEAAGDTGD